MWSYLAAISGTCMPVQSLLCGLLPLWRKLQLAYMWVAIVASVAFLNTLIFVDGCVDCFVVNRFSCPHTYTATNSARGIPTTLAKLLISSLSSPPLSSLSSKRALAWRQQEWGLGRRKTDKGGERLKPEKRTEWEKDLQGENRGRIRCPCLWEIPFFSSVSRIEQ